MMNEPNSVPVIAPIAAHDIDIITDVWVEAHAARKVGFARDAERMRTVMRRRVSDPTAWFVGATPAGADRPIAIIHGLAGRADDGDSEIVLPGVMHISLVAVLPPYWGQGIGTSLLRHGIEIGRARGYRSIQLWAAASNTRAIRVYRNVGFAPDGRDKLDDLGERVIHLASDVRDLAIR